MAVCNLLKKLNDKNGIFYIFSQYAEDVTKATTIQNYKVSPSKFYVLNIDYSKQTNISVPYILQNLFENGCAYGRNYSSDDFKFTPDLSRNLFWNTMVNNIMTLGKDKLLPELIYIGDIDVKSYGIENGVGYDEIFCYIPNNSKKLNVKYKDNGSSGDQSLILQYNKNYVEGYKYSDYVAEYDMIYPGDWQYGDIIYSLNGYEYNYNPLFEFESEQADDQSYTFNTIIPCYNVTDENNILYADIPMGIYFTGCIVGESGSAHMKYPVTIYTSHEDIYNEGTAYGLRICTRFTPNYFDNSNIEINQVQINTINDVMLEFGKVIDTVNNMVGSNVQYINKTKELYNIFKNSRTNVPYSKLVNNEYHWFVNGRDTGQKVTASLRGNIGSGIGLKNVITSDTSTVTDIINNNNVIYNEKIDSLQSENNLLKQQVDELNKTLNKIINTIGFVDSETGGVSTNFISADKYGLVPVDKLPIEIMTEDEYDNLPTKSEDKIYGTIED